MDLFKTNKEYWLELLHKGMVYSHTRNGPPHAGFESIVAHRYTFLMIGIVVVGIVLMVLTPAKKWRWRSFVPFIIVSSVAGWAWGAWMLHADQVFPGWLNPPWSVAGPEFIMVMEDWMFYPGCAVLFYAVFRWAKPNLPPLYSHKANVVIISIYSAVTLLVLIFTRTAGRSQALMFAIPGIVCFALCWKQIDVRRFLLFQIFIVGFECVWDWFAVSWIHYIPGFAWGSEWIYVSFDQAGQYAHSNIFLDYGKHPWAWVFDNPLEITPWFGIVGGIENYAFITLLDKLLYKENHDGAFSGTE